MKKRITAKAPLMLLSEPNHQTGSVIRTIPTGESLEYTQIVIRDKNEYFQTVDSKTKQKGYIQANETSISVWKPLFVSDASISYFTFKILKEEDKDRPFDSFVSIINPTDPPLEGQMKVNIEIRKTKESPLQNYMSFSYNPTEIRIEARKMVAGDALIVNPDSTIQINGFLEAIRESGQQVYVPMTSSYSMKNEEAEQVVVITLTIIITLLIMGAFFLAGWIVFGKLLIIVAGVIAIVVMTIVKMFYSVFEMIFNLLFRRR